MNTLALDSRPQCPERRKYRYDFPAFCELNDKHCLLDAGLDCEIYNEYLKEVASEEIVSPGK